MKITAYFGVFTLIILIFCNTVNINNDDELNNNKEWVVYDTTNSNLVDNIINCIIIDKNDVKWIGTGRKGIVTYDGSTWQYLNSQVEELNMGSIWSMAFERNDDFSSSLVYAGDYSRFILYHYDTTFFSEDSFSIWDSVVVYDTTNNDFPGNIKHICIINENRWLGTNYYGLMKVNWLNEWEYFTKENSSLPDNRIGDMAVDSSASLWIGTHNGLVSIKNDKWTIYDSSNAEILTVNHIKSISVDNDNKKWMVLNNNEVKVWSDSISSFKTVTHDLFQKGIITVHADQFGDVWFLISEGNILKKSGETWDLYNEKTTGFSFLGGTNIAVDSKRVPWIGTISGIYTLE